MSDLFAIPAETKEMLEAVLFAAGHPVSYAKLAQILEVSADEAKNLVLDFAAEYNDGKVTRGIQLLTFDDCCQLCTKPDYIGEIRMALGIRRGGNLSNSSLKFWRSSLTISRSPARTSTLCAVWIRAMR